MMDFSPKFDSRFKRQLRRHFESFEVTVGIHGSDASKVHRSVMPDRRTSVDGMASNMPGSGAGGRTVGSVAKRLLSRVNFITLPFERRDSNAAGLVRKGIGGIIKSRGSQSSIQALSSALLRFVRDPIKQRKYGGNTQQTILAKGFNRRLLNTGQLWNSIKAKVTFKRRSGV